ncbi:MAG: hypothetical protein ACFFBD_05700 [Candidatus Hodarchaeota archaeon]
MFQYTDIFEIISIFLPLIIVIGLTVVIWIIGGRINKRTLRSIEAELERVVKGRIVDSLDVEGASAASMVFVGTPLIRDLRSFKTVVSLEERHLLITFIFSLVSKPQDYVLFEANLPERPPVAIEIMPWREKRLIEKNSKELTKLELLEFRNEKFDEAFMVRASRRGAALEILGDKELFKTLYQSREFLYWISVDPKETPHLKVMGRWNKAVKLDKMAEIFLVLAKRTNESEYDKKKKTYGGKQKKEKSY